MIEITRMELNPGDRLIVKVNRLLSDAEYENIAQQIMKWAGDIPVLVLDTRACVTVITKEV